MTPSILSSNNTLTTSINHHSLRPSLIDSDLHEIEDIMTAVNDDVFNDNDLLVSEDIPLEDNLKNEDQLLNDIDFSQWSDEENDEAKVDSGNTGIPVEIPTGYKFLRGMIEECNEQMYYDHHGRLGREKILKVKFTQLSTTVTITGHVHLRDDWFSTPIRLGTYIHLNGPLDERGSCMVDNQHSNIVIIHPDLLISNTQLSDSFICQRRSTLQGRIRVSGQSNTAMTYGLMLHELLQRTLQSSNFSDDSLNMCINELIQNNLESLYYVEEDETMAEKHLKEMLPNLKFWMSSFLGGEPREYVESMTSSGSVRMAIRKVLDIEEGIWSPSYGIKGVIDASLEIVHTTPSGYGYNRSNGNEETVSIVPLEVKTGRASNYLAHQAQTLLYTLLMSDRYDQSIDLGLLYYLKSGTTKLMSARDNEIRGLLITRNELADYLANTSRLPPLQKNAYKCQRCFAVDACAIYHKALEKGTQESFGVEELFDERTRHLTEEQTEFLRHWDRLVTMEEQEMNKFKGEIWSMSSRERESVGRCIGGLIIDTDFDKDTKDYQRQMVSRYRYRFIRSTVDEHRQTTNYHNTNVKVVSKSFLNSHITIGDPVVISTEHGQIAMAIGFVLDMNEEQIVVGIDRSLNNRGSLLVGNSSSSSVQVPTLFRLDKDELSSGMATLRYNLVRLFTIGGCDQRRRALIVDLAPPSFKSTVDDTVISSIDRLNSDQQAAINKVLTGRWRGYSDIEI
ncbi:DNA replication factor Dna2-domain-containing protein [Syncephalis fuscata]|nr:DNA replication factor Dna2-domain-containing protein [Syncephalis fuscata]